MLRFRIKEMLFVVAIAAVWLCTFCVTDPHAVAIGNLVRKWILLVIFLTAGSAAVLYRGKRRAFWAGFFITMLVIFASSILPEEFTLDVQRASLLFRNYLNSQIETPLTIQLLIQAGVYFALIFGLSSLVGYIAAYIHDDDRRIEN